MSDDTKQKAVSVIHQFGFQLERSDRAYSRKLPMVSNDGDGGGSNDSGEDNLIIQGTSGT